MCSSRAHPRIERISPRCLTELRYLSITHPQHRKQLGADPLQDLMHVPQAHNADLLGDRALRPGPDRALQPEVAHVPEARGAQALGVARAGGDVDAEHRRRRPHLEAPLLHGQAGGAAVVAAQRQAELLQLDPAAGLERAVRLRDEPPPVRDAHAERARVDEVELVGEVGRPRLVRVVDEPRAVHGHVLGLDGAEVRPDDVRARVCECELDRPCCGAC